MSAEQLDLINIRLPLMLRLRIRIAVDASVVQLPPLLRSLELKLYRYHSAASLQQAIEAVARLQHLRLVIFWFGSRSSGAVSLAPLARLPNLIALKLGCLKEASNEQM